jgi:hypothetical protein
VLCAKILEKKQGSERKRKKESGFWYQLLKQLQYATRNQTINDRRSTGTLRIYVSQTQMRKQQNIGGISAFLHTIPYDGEESTCFASSGHLFDYGDGTTPIHC